MRRTLAYQVVAFMAFLLACGITAVASTQTRTLRIVTYNIDADQGQNGSQYTLPQPGLIAPSSGGSVTNGGVLEGIGEEIVAGDPAQPIDILALEETTSNAATVLPIVNGLNACYSYNHISAVYTMSPTQATSCCGTPTNGGGPNAIVYNTNTVQLIASVPVDPPGGTSNLGSISGEYREVMRYEFAPAGVTPTTDNEFYIYVSHYKASSGSPNTTYRAEEAGIIRTNSATLPSNARVLYVGDYNVYSSSEASYQTITGTGIGIQGIDPLNVTGANGISFSGSSLMNTKTESATSLSARFDFQIMSSNVYNGVAGGLAYVPGTYHTFANNGTTPYRGSVNSGSDTALTGNLSNTVGITASQLYQYLTTATDHLPVVADYTIPVPSPFIAPVATFTASPTNGVVPLNVTFTDTSSGPPTSWAWTFGDGGTSTSQSPSYAYTTPGAYTAMLIASNAAGWSTNTQAITALEPPPVASFTTGPTSGAAPWSVSFTDTSTAFGSITGWAWAFGDGNTSTNQNPSDLYLNPGTYTVQEIVSGSGGSGTDTVANLINVYAPFAWWQLNYFGSTNNPNAAPGADATGTGMSNTNKFLAGFNPTNPAAYLHVIRIVQQPVAGNTNVVVTYLGPSGDNTYTPGIALRTNVLDYSTGDANGNYANGGWQDTGQTNILSGGNGSGAVTNMVDSAIPAPSTTRYYRVRVLLP
ncbi:MAG: PKD domain-containing protein [Verrucomicrobiia bacterium]